MDTTGTSWWSCAGCGIDVELADGELSGFAVDCPDCGEIMVQWRTFDVAA